MKFKSLTRIYGKEFVEYLKQQKLLIIGVGGIGCEILKNLLVFPFSNIEIVSFIHFMK